MSQSKVLTQIQTAFSPYIKSPEDLHNARLDIAKYIASLQPQQQVQSGDPKTSLIPPHVTGLRRQYLEALHDNYEAKREFANLQDQVRSQATRQSDAESVDLSHVKATQTHLVLLHLRRQHQKYQILTDYLSQAESLASQNQIFDTQPTVIDPSSYKTDIPQSSQEQADLQARINDLNRALKLAVLQGHHQLNRSRTSLDDLKASRDSTESPSPEAKLRALTATNKELTRWIEESLAKCDSAFHDESTVDREALLSEDPDLAQHNHPSVNDTYEKYIAARKRLLDAAITLTSPLPASVSPSISAPTSSNPSTNIHNKEPKTRSHQRTSSFTTNSNTHHPTTSLLPHLTNIHLPHLSHQTSTNQAKTHIETILANHETSLTEQLLRLSEESHLLSSYPILVKPNPKMRKGDGGGEVSQTERLLEAWRFAMGAAGTTTGATVEKQVKIGSDAVDEVDLVLDGLQEEERLWERLEAVQR